MGAQFVPGHTTWPPGVVQVTLIAAVVHEVSLAYVTYTLHASAAMHHLCYAWWSCGVSGYKMCPVHDIPTIT